MKPLLCILLPVILAACATAPDHPESATQTLTISPPISENNIKEVPKISPNTENAIACTNDVSNGQIHLAKGNLGAAKAKLTSASIICERKSSSVGMAHYYLGLICAFENNFREANTHFVASLEVREWTSVANVEQKTLRSCKGSKSYKKFLGGLFAGFEGKRKTEINVYRELLQSRNTCPEVRERIKKSLHDNATL